MKIETPFVAVGCESVEQVIEGLERLGCLHVAAGDRSISATLPNGFTIDRGANPHFVVRDEVGDTKITGRFEGNDSD